MDAKALAIPGTIQHSRDARSDADLRGEVAAHHEAHPGVRFLTDVITAVHAAGEPARVAHVFHGQFSPRTVMDALERRPDLRARIAHAITGVLLCITIIGIPLGVANFKLVPVALMPLGREIVAS